ncbi:MAG: hypothetical protein ACTHL8_18940 [Burkholderiaceae bacterium]
MSATPITLPRPLEPWREWLGWFDAALAEHLGDLLVRLSALVGPARSKASAGRDEPDGVSDLRTRGSYERLLGSEWLLAQEMPDEFLRRAAASEHLFLAPQMRAPRVDRDVVALFDAGPLQLGAPRLGHLAAWILLARRAQELGGRLRWGLAQEPGTLLDADRPERLKALLDARRHAALRAEHVAAWDRALEAQTAADGSLETETWWVGAGLPAGVPVGNVARRVLVLRRAVDGSGLEASLDGAGGSRDALLPLPAVREGTALLRGEFRAAAVPARRLAPGNRVSGLQPPIFSRRTEHLLIAGAEAGSVLSFAIPSRGQHRIGPPRRQQWSAARLAFGVVLDGRQAGALCLDDQALHFWQLPGFESRPRPTDEEFTVDVDATGWRPAALLTAHDKRRRVCVVDDRGRLLSWDAPAPSGSAPPRRPATPEVIATAPTLHESRVLGLLQTATHQLVVVARRGTQLQLRRLGARGTTTTLRRPLFDATSEVDADAAFLAGLDQSVCAAAVRTAAQPEGWVLLAARPGLPVDGAQEPTRHEITLTPHERALGLVLHGTGQGAVPALVCLGADRRRLALVSPGTWGRSPLYETASPIETCAVDPQARRLALVTQAGELVVLDIERAAPLLVSRPAAAEERP